VSFYAGKLYVGHRLDGVEVFDIADHFKMSKVADTKGTNGVVIIPEFGLGVAGAGNGNVTVFKLSSLREVVKFSAGTELDSTVYDPVTKQLMTVNTNVTADGKGQVLNVYSVPSFKLVNKVTIPADDVEHSVADGLGNVYFAAQDNDSILRLNMKTLQVTGNWPTTGATQPTGLALDNATHRLFIAGRGHLTDPVFEVMDANDGHIVYKAAISQGNDGVAFDPKSGMIFATDGIGANMFVFHEDSADAYKLAEIVDTSTNQRTLALDPTHNKVYTIAAEGLVDPAKKILTKVSPFYPNVFTPNSFMIREYGQD